jgi:hypothetical protein
MPESNQVAPELDLNQTHVYREFAPPAHLRGSIACLWARRGDGGTVRIIPDACSDIIWRPGHGAVVAGPDTRPSLVHTEAGQAIFGARLLPGAGGSALGLPLDELRDLRVPLADLGLDPREWLGGGLDPRDAPRLLAATAARLAAEVRQIAPSRPRRCAS